MRASTDEQALRCTLMDIDVMAQGGLSAIETIARLALARLESPDAYQSMDWLAALLSTISAQAIDLENFINSEAGRHGCNYVDALALRRWDAIAAHRARQEAGLPP